MLYHLQLHTRPVRSRSGCTRKAPAAPQIRRNVCVHRTDFAERLHFSKQSLHTQVSYQIHFKKVM